MALTKTEDRIPVYEEKIKVLTKRLEDRQRLLAESYDLLEKRKAMVAETKKSIEVLQDKLAHAQETVKNKQNKAASQQQAAKRRQQREEVRQQQEELFKLMDVINDSGKSLEDVISLLQSVEPLESDK